MATPPGTFHNALVFELFSSPSDEAKKKKTRCSAPKTRTGCNTCKKRRIKCDETKPTCNNCSRSKRICLGLHYSGDLQLPNGGEIMQRASKERLSPLSRIRNYQSTLDLAADPNASNPLDATGTCDDPKIEPVSPSPSIFLFNFSRTSSEHRSFDFFIYRTSPALAGYFDTGPFGGSCIPRMAAMGKPVHHALIALASLHEDYLMFGEFEERSTQTFALDQYNKAIRALHDELSENEPQFHVIILTCLMFVCLEFMRGRMERGMEHLKAGLNMWAAYQESRAKESPSPTDRNEPDDVGQQLSQAFARLSLQASTLGQPVPEGLYDTDAFKNEAINTSKMHKIASAQTRLTSIMSYYNCSSNLATFNSPIPSNSDVQDERYNLVTRLQDWKRDMEEFLHEKSQDLSKREIHAVYTLQIQNIMALIWHWATMSDSECAFDNHVRHFSSIVSLATIIIYDQLKARTGDSRPTSSQSLSNSITALALDNENFVEPFSFEVGIICALYFTAIKCRCPVLRRRAVQLLTKANPRREGMWHAGMLKEIAERAIEIEEAGSLQLATQNIVTWPKEGARLRVVHFMPIQDLARRKQEVTFVKRGEVRVAGETESWVEVIEF